MTKEKLTPEQKLKAAFEKENERSAKIILRRYGPELEITKKDLKMFLVSSIRDMGSIEILELLLEIGAKPDKDAILETIYAYYIYRCTIGGGKEYLTMLEKLLEHGAKPNFLCVQEAVKYNWSSGLIRLLKTEGVALTNRSIAISINNAVDKGHYEIVQILMEFGANSKDVSVDVLNKAKRLSKQWANYAATIMALQGARIEID